jgi:predicted RNA-binding Zn-ribbon protein involved in translation (DUF1610 family)
VQAVERHEVSTEATVQETCPKCGKEEVKFTAVQLRSADEGSTIIYSCECGHSYVKARWSTWKIATNTLSQMAREQLVFYERANHQFRILFHPMPQH